MQTNYNLVCPQCGNTFESHNPNQECCSRSCATTKRNYARGRTLYDHICVQCGKDFQTQDHRPYSFCSKSCNSAYQNHVYKSNTPEHFWAQVDKVGECWIWTGPLNKYGYGKTAWHGKQITAHRLAYELSHGPIPDGQCVCHTCDTRPCIRPDHLWLGSPAENTHDMMAKGRGAYQASELNGQAKFGWAEVDEIRRAYFTHELTRPQLAVKFHVAKGTIDKIIREEHWPISKHP